MQIPFWSAFGPIINWIKNHQLSGTLVKNAQYEEVKPFLSEALELALKLEKLIQELEGSGNMGIREWAQYDKELETLVTSLNIHLRNHPSFAMQAIKYDDYSQDIFNALSTKNYGAASDLRLEQVKLRDKILLNWVKYYLDVIGALGILNQKVGIHETDETQRYLKSLIDHLEHGE